MRFRPLQALHAVIETGTVTEAAKLLGISQPATSNLLTQIEHQTKLKLFTRKNGRLIPTHEAEILYRDVDTVIRGMKRVDASVIDLQNQRTGTLQVVSTHSISFGFMTKLVAEFLHENPEIDITFQTRYSKKIQQWVSSGLIEVGICEAPVMDTGLESITLKFECKLAIPNKHPLSQKSLITPKDLDNIPFIVMGENHITTHQIKGLMLKAGNHWQIKCQSHLFRSVLEFVKMGIGVSFIDPFTLANDNGEGYVVKTMRSKVFLQMAIIKSKNRPISNLGDMFYQRVHEEMLTHAFQE